MIKTVFGEEVKVGDEIMYIYQNYDDMLSCFGKVFKLESKEVQFFNVPQPVLHVHKTFEIRNGRTSKKCDVNVILTNPTIFKCGKPIKYPKSE